MVTSECPQMPNAAAAPTHSSSSASSPPHSRPRRTRGARALCSRPAPSDPSPSRRLQDTSRLAPRPPLLSSHPPLLLSLRLSISLSLSVGCPGSCRSPDGAPRQVMSACTSTSATTTASPSRRSAPPSTGTSVAARSSHPPSRLSQLRPAPCASPATGSAKPSPIVPKAFGVIGFVRLR